MAGPENLKALIFVLVVLIAAAFCRPQFKDDPISLRLCLYWIIAAIVVLGLEPVWLRFAAIGILSIALSPRKLYLVPAFYIGALFAVPSRMEWRIPFPGVQYLVDMENALLLSLTVLLPAMAALMFGTHPDLKRGKTPFLDILVLVIAIASGVLVTRGEFYTPTNVLRFVMTSICLIYVPYFVFSRTLVTREAMRAFMLALVTVGTISAAVGLLNVLQNYNHYLLAATNNMFNLSYYRSGEVRVAVTSTPHILAMVMVAASFALWHLREKSTSPLPLVYAWFPAMALVFLATQARGAYLGGMAAVCAFVLLRIKSPVLRYGLAAGGLASAWTGYSILAGSNFDTVDQYGTFDYRQRLIAATIKEVREHPWFSTPDYMKSENFADLVNGMGIIDFVNTFAQYALNYGLVGLGLYLLYIVAASLGVVGTADRLRNHPDATDGDRAFGVGLAAFMAGYLVLCVTLSQVNYMDQIMMGGLGIMVGYVRRYQSFKKPALGQQRSAAPTVTPPVQTEATAAQAAAKSPKQAPTPVPTAVPHTKPDDYDFSHVLRPGTKRPAG